MLEDLINSAKIASFIFMLHSNITLDNLTLNPCRYLYLKKTKYHLDIIYARILGTAPKGRFN